MKTFSREQYLQLLGLLTLAQHHSTMLTSLTDAAIEILGGDDPMEIIADAVWSGKADIDGLLERLDIRPEALTCSI
jgi:hypothetical protein